MDVDIGPVEKTIAKLFSDIGGYVKNEANGVRAGAWFDESGSVKCVAVPTGRSCE